MAAMDANTAAAAPAIPFHDLGRDGPLALLDAARPQLEAILAAGRAHYGPLVLRAGDALSRLWLRRAGNPYQAEIAALARRLDQPGAYVLNVSYEWSCTTGIGIDPAGDGLRMLRTLDWALGGLGRHVVVVRRDTPAGELFDVTWPGCVGVLTAMAPGRFAAAINQPPMRRWTGWWPLDWLVGRLAAGASRALPPAHLLRQVFETCRTYAEAKAMLADTPLAVPAFFTLAGCREGEGCILERTETGRAIHTAPASISNHWLGIDRAGHDRGIDSRTRLATMERLRDRVEDGVGWVTSPILNDQTRLAVVANPAAGRLRVCGYEDGKPTTQEFIHPAPRCGGRAGTTPAPDPGG